MRAGRVAAAAAVLVVLGSVLILVGHRQLSRPSDLDLLRRSPAAGLLPPAAVLTARRLVDGQRLLHNPAFLRTTAETSSSSVQVRDFYRSALSSRGFLVEHSIGHPLGETEDAYIKGRVIALVDVPVDAGSPLTFSFELSIVRT